MERENIWWQEEILYEVYVRSFKDSNGDGIGDLQGIIQQLDYLEWLGIKAIWLTPIYCSPMKDFGYDISDYYNVDPIYGTNDDFTLLLNEVHKRKIRLIMDLVPNHTSNLHPWFKESASSIDNDKRHWYHWKKDKNGMPPNNWLSAFGGSAWEWNDTTQQYYYHAFLKEQPDLNLRNKDVVNEILKIMRHWLDLGVDGFRIDALWHLIKDKHWRDNPINPFYIENSVDSAKLLPVYSCDQPEVHDVIQKMRQVTDEYEEKVLIGELYLPENKIVSYYGDKNNGVHLPANFSFLFVNWNAREIAVMVDKYEAALPNYCWAHWVLGNHDRPRLASRLGEAQARNAALLLFTLRGTPSIYFGDEIGMPQTNIPLDKIKDPQGVNMQNRDASRDLERTPMQWNSKENAGFTEGKPWLPVAQNFEQRNVEVQLNEHNSMLNLYRRLIALRQTEQSLRTGKYFPVVNNNEYIFSFMRSEDKHDSFLIVANFSDSSQEFRPAYDEFSGKIDLSTVSVKIPDVIISNSLVLAPNEAVIIRLSEKIEQ